MSEEAPKKHSQFALYVAAILAAVGGVSATSFPVQCQSLHILIVFSPQFISGYDTGRHLQILKIFETHIANLYCRCNLWYLGHEPVYVSIHSLGWQ